MEGTLFRKRRREDGESARFERLPPPLKEPRRELCDTPTAHLHLTARVRAVADGRCAVDGWTAPQLWELARIWRLSELAPPLADG